MAQPKFPTPTLKEYQALLELKRNQFLDVYVEFSGSGDSGNYYDIEFTLSEEVTIKGQMYYSYQKARQEFKTALDIVEKYIERVLDSLSEINFNDEGCRGRFFIDLSTDPPQADLFTEVPMWVEGDSITEEITPATATEQFVAESLS